MQVAQSVLRTQNSIKRVRSGENEELKGTGTDMDEDERTRESITTFGCLNNIYLTAGIAGL